MTIRVLLADDQALLRSAFRVLVDSEPDMEVVGQASDGAEAVRLAEGTAGRRGPHGHPDARHRRSRRDPPDHRRPGARPCPDRHPDHLRGRRLRGACAAACASGFLGKGSEPEEPLNAIRVAAGRRRALLSPTATKGLIARFLAQGGDGPDGERDPDRADRLDALTVREREVLVLVAVSATPNDEIAERLQVSPLTVKTHVNRAMAKLGARDRAQLVVIAYESGLVRPRVD
ncbi:Two-component system response regulator OS=Streptomyces glaucescens OX=1907 GN=SGLAU_09870 PE=4 SV=1 [Streptomyces glaucescens]